MKALNKMLLGARELDLFKCLKVGVGEHTEEKIHIFFANDTMLF